jgi:hypothetical protein
MSYSQVVDAKIVVFVDFMRPAQDSWVIKFIGSNNISSLHTA